MSCSPAGSPIARCSGDSLKDPDALMAQLVREGGAAKLELFGLFTLVY